MTEHESNAEFQMDDQIPAEDAARVRRCLNLLTEVWSNSGLPSRESESRTFLTTSESTLEAIFDQLLDMPILKTNEDGVFGDSEYPFGRFVIRRLIGTGGQGMVFQAFDPSLNRDVALKIPRPESLASSDILNRMIDESHVLASLSHPNLVPMFEAGTVGPVFYLASEYCPGMSLSKWLKQASHQMPVEIVASILLDLAETVDYVHRRGVLHRDIKPSNVLLVDQSDGRSDDPFPYVVKLTDFGLAKMIGIRSGHTRSDEVVGTPTYMAPEQAEGRLADIGTATDVYGLGAVMYRLLTGQPPHHGATEVETLRRLMNESIISPRGLRPDIPRDLETICQKALAREIPQRYQNARDLADDIRRYQTGHPVSARPLGPACRLVRWYRRRPLVASLLVALFMVLVGGVTGVAWQWGRANQEWRRAEQLASQNHRRLVRQYVDRAISEIEKGDDLAALPWLVETLRLDQGRPDREQIHRIRLAAVLDRCPKLYQCWFHDQAIYSGEFSPDGRFVVTASEDGTARIWNVQTGKITGSPLRHDSALWCARFSPSGRLIVTTSGDETARIWETSNGLPVGPPLQHGCELRAASFSPDETKVATSTRDGRARIWLVPSGQPLTDWLQHTPHRDSANRIECVVFSHDGLLLATAGCDGSARIWCANTGQLLHTLRHGSIEGGKTVRGAVHMVGFSPDDTRLLTTSDDSTAGIWDVRSGQRLATCKHQGIVNRAVFSPCGRRIVTSSSDYTARVWDAVTGAPITPPLRHDSTVYDARFSPNGTKVATASWDHSARLWNAETGDPLTAPLKQCHYVVGVRFNPAGNLLLAYGQDGVARLWQLPDESPDYVVLQHDANVEIAAFDPAGQIVATGSGDHAVRLWDAQQQELIARPLMHGGPITSIQFSRDGEFLLTSGHDRSARLWAVDRPFRPKFTFRHGYPIEVAVFSPDDSWIATGDDHGHVRVWDASNGSRVPLTIKQEEAIEFLAFSPDRRHLLFGGGECDAQVCDISSDGLRARVLEHPRSVNHASFCPAGEKILTSGYSPSFAPQHAKVWSRSGQLLFPPSQHTGALIWSEFSPDGQRFATCSYDCTSRIWHADSGKPLTPPMQHGRPVWHLAFHPSGNMLATASGDRMVRLWDVLTGQLVAIPIEHDAGVSHVNISADGRRMVTASKDGTARLAEIPFNAQPLDALSSRSIVLSGHEIDETGSLVSVDVTQLRRIWRGRSKE